MNAGTIALLLATLQSTPVASGGLPVKKVALDRPGWVLGVGLGPAVADGELSGAGTARLGHSINPHWFVMYDLQAFTPGDGWHAVQNAVVQWHVTSRLYVRGGLGLGYAPVDGDDAVAGPSQVAGVGWELGHGTGHTFTVEGSFTRFSRADQTDAVATWGLLAGVNLY